MSATASVVSPFGVLDLLHALRVAAARLHCELLLVYMQADTQADHFNDASVLYWSIVGLWLAPGNTVCTTAVRMMKPGSSLRGMPR